MTSEREIILRAKQGDTRAFEQLMQTHALYVYNLLYRMVNDVQEAEDLSQEVFLRAWRKIRSFRGDSQFKTWIHRIATNLCYNRLPNLKKEVAEIDISQESPLVSQQVGVERSVINAEKSQSLADALIRMPENYRLLLILRHLQEFSYNEISEITGLPLGTVKTGIFRARQMLKERMVGVGNDIYG